MDKAFGSIRKSCILGDPGWGGQRGTGTVLRPQQRSGGLADKDGNPTLSHNGCVILGKALLPNLQLPHR